MTDRALDERCINTIRFLSADMVEKARSGHPGTPMGAATMAYVLWDRFLRHNPRNPRWPDRDRFVLSAGHACALLYSLLHLSGYDLPMDELKRFRQWESKTPGHPEYGLTPGVETTTGPLGQGFANAVGMALAEAWLRRHYNRPGHDVCDHHTYVLASDGDLQEGIVSEAASLAGHLGLGRLICLYDDNGIQIEGPTAMAFSEDVAMRFRSHGWRVLGPLDGFDVSGLETAIAKARERDDKPSLIICKTLIGFGSPRENSAKAHGEPLGAENLRAAKEKLAWPLEPAFHVPDDVRSRMDRRERGSALETAWRGRWKSYERAFPDLARRFEMETSGALPDGWERAAGGLFPPGSPPVATRAASGRVLNALAGTVHALTGGSADLAPSNMTRIDRYSSLPDGEGCAHNLHFGVREHAMGAIASGMSLHGGPIPYTGTFLTFSDYMRPSIRLAALMGIRVIYLFTHDSVGLGEDGPTHQPVEHLMSLRAVPNLTVHRPCDANETAEAWKSALKKTTGPSAIVLTRQNLPVLDRERCAPADGASKGAYVLWEGGPEGRTPDLILLATGSEVHIALDAGHRLAARDAGDPAGDGLRIRVVSFPAWDLFDAQPAAYRDSVLPPEVRARVAVEAGLRIGWERYVGLDGAAVGMDGFGASAPGDETMERFGFTAENVVRKAREILDRRGSSEGSGR